MKFTFLPLLTFSFLALCPALSAAERVALVIGNNAYQHGTPLKNCVNDAKAVAAALKRAGFEVIVAEDAGLETMEKKVLDFRRAAQGAKAAWFHYSGHGVEVQGSNYLVPVDADVTEEFQVKHKAYALDQMLGAMEEAGTPLKVVVLDCCRDNPFGRGWNRSGAKGLAQVAGTPEGTIIAFATSPGKVAADGAGANSPFTTALVGALGKPGLDVKEVFNETGREVLVATGKAQQPWINSSFFDRYVLIPEDGAPLPLEPDPPAAGDSPLDRGEVGQTYVAKLPGGAEMTFCYCPPGTFTMGSPKSEPQRKLSGDENQVMVRITQGYWLAKTETTQAQWRGVMGTAPSEFNGANLPVETVSWDGAQAFIGKLNAAGVMPAGWKWALPTEAQWEYACRAGTKTAFSFGNSLNGREANVNGNSPYGVAAKGPFLEKTSEVGTYAANQWGLHDMHGNVREWCGDWCAEALVGGADPKGPLTGVLRVFRGGSWRNIAAGDRAAFRGYLEPGSGGDSIGFRPALVPSK